MRRILWIGDAGVPSGFARATHEILGRICQDFDVTVMGINYRGDPHDYPYPIYAAAPGGDSFGIGRLIWMCDKIKPHVIVVQNDGWNIPAYTRTLMQFKEHCDVPVIAVVAVDGKNFQAEWLSGVSHAIFWTEFAEQEAILAGYTGPSSVIPLGVDQTVYFPEDKDYAREMRFRGLYGTHVPRGAFIVGNVNRNQPRKRWDLTIEYFAHWVRESLVTDAYLFLHVAPTGDTGVNVQQLARYYGVDHRLLISEPPTWYGDTEEAMRHTYNCFDVQITTTQGEGFGLTTLEGMACGVPQVAPEWSALAEVGKNAACLVKCSNTAIGPPYVNVIGGVPDRDEFVAMLEALYRHEEHRSVYSRLGRSRAAETRFAWNNIAERYANILDEIAHDVDQPVAKEEIV